MAAPRSSNPLQFSLRSSLVAFALICVFLALFAPTLWRTFEDWSDRKSAPVRDQFASDLPPQYVRAIDALERKEIRPGMSLEQLSAVSAPNQIDNVGPFTACHYTGYVGMQSLSITAKNGRLVRAVDFGCTYAKTYFDTMTNQDNAEYHQLLQECDASTD